MQDTSHRERLATFNGNPLCMDIAEDQEVKSILRLLVNQWSKPSWNNPLWSGKHCKFMCNHGLQHVQNVFRYAGRLYYSMKGKINYLDTDADKFRLIVAIWLHDWGMTGPKYEKKFSEINKYLKEVGGYKPNIKEEEIDDIWIRKNHSLISCFNILRGYKLIDEEHLMDRVPELKKLRDDVADLVCYHSSSTPLTRQQRENEKYELQICPLEEKNASLVTLSALLRILDACDETWYRVAEDFWEYERWLNDHRAHEINGKIEDLLHKHEISEATALFKALDDSDIKGALKFCDEIAAKNISVSAELAEKVKEFQEVKTRSEEAFRSHTLSKADIWDVFFELKNGNVVEIVLFPFGFRYGLTDAKRTFLEKTVVKRIEKEIDDSRDYFQKLGIRFAVRLARSQDMPERLEVPESLSIYADGLLKELNGRLLTADLFSRATDEEITDFYCGDQGEKSWRVIASDGDIRRVQEKDILEETSKNKDRFGIICVVAEPGAGKTTVARRVAYELFRQNQLVIRFPNDNPNVWHKLPQLAEHIGHHFYILIDDMFRNQYFVKVLEETEENLPVTVLATSRLAEYHEGRLRNVIRKIELRLSAEEKDSLLRKMGKSYEQLTPEVQKHFREADLFLVLGMVLTKGKGFDDIILDIIRSLVEGDTRYPAEPDKLAIAYRYVCFSHSYGLAIPEKLLESLDDRGRFSKILEKPRSRGVFYEELQPSYSIRFIRSGAELIAAKAVEIFSKPPQGVPIGPSFENTFSEILDASKEDDSIQRYFSINLMNRVLHGGTVENADAIIAQNKRINSIIGYARISELDILRSIFNEIRMKDKADDCTKHMLSTDPVTTADLQLQISELRSLGLADKSIPLAKKWMLEHPDDRSIFIRYLSLVKEIGKRTEIDEAVDDALRWIERHPEDANIRTVLFSLLCQKGYHARQEQVDQVIQDNKTWLGDHPDDRITREGYIVLVRNLGNKKQIEETILDAISWLENNPDDFIVRSILISLIVKRGFFDRNYIKQVLDHAERYMKTHELKKQLFQNYMTLVRKLQKLDIGIRTDDDLVRQFCKQFLDSSDWIHNIKTVENIADWLRDSGKFQEAESIYIKLESMEIMNPIVKSGIFFGFGKVLLGEAMKLDLGEERIEKLVEAEKKFTRALTSHKGHHMAHAFLYITQTELGKEDAERELDLAEWWAPLDRASKENMTLYSSNPSRPELIEELKRGNIPAKIREDFEQMLNPLSQNARIMRVASIPNRWRIVDDPRTKDKNYVVLSEKNRAGEYMLNVYGGFSFGECVYKIAIFYLEFGYPEEALRWLEIAVKEDPQNFANWWNKGVAEMNLAISLEQEGDHGRAVTLYRSTISSLETSVGKHSELQLPASEEIPRRIEECKLRLKRLGMKGQLVVYALQGRDGNVVGRAPDGKIVLFDGKHHNSSLVKPGDVVRVAVIKSADTYYIVQVLEWVR